MVVFEIKVIIFVVISAVWFITEIIQIAAYSQVPEYSENSKYSRPSLSRLWLSQITAYLEEKIWSLF